MLNTLFTSSGDVPSLIPISAPSIRTTMAPDDSGSCIFTSANAVTGAVADSDLSTTESRDVLEIVEARHQIGSTIFCSQFSPEGWHPKIGESTLADAILDRIVHDSYSIFIDGDDSMRRRKGINK